MKKLNAFLLVLVIIPFGYLFRASFFFQESTKNSSEQELTSLPIPSETQKNLIIASKNYDEIKPHSDISKNVNPLFLNENKQSTNDSELLEIVEEKVEPLVKNELLQEGKFQTADEALEILFPDIVREQKYKEKFKIVLGSMVGSINSITEKQKLECSEIKEKWNLEYNQISSEYKEFETDMARSKERSRRFDELNKKFTPKYLNTLTNEQLPEFIEHVKEVHKYLFDASISVFSDSTFDD